jgi:hypothetical protein
MFYADLGGHLQEAKLRFIGEDLEVVEVTPVFTRVRVGHGYQYDVARDGDRALVVVPVAAPGTVEPLMLVENWPALRR